MSTEQAKNNYESISSSLLNWIEQKCRQLQDRQWPNSLVGMRQEMLEFKAYRTEEKPSK